MRSPSTYLFNRKQLLLKIYLAGVITIMILITGVFLYFSQFGRSEKLEMILFSFIFYEQLWLQLFAIILISTAVWSVVRHKLFNRSRFILGLVALFLFTTYIELPHWVRSAVRPPGSIIRD